MFWISPEQYGEQVHRRGKVSITTQECCHETRIWGEEERRRERGEGRGEEEGEKEGRRRGEGGERGGGRGEGGEKEGRRRGEGGEKEGSGCGGEGGEREGSGCGREGGEGGGKSTIPSALVEEGHVSARGLWREDVMCHLYL